METEEVNSVTSHNLIRKPPSYSVETPYGFHLDLDFVKYVEDIEKGNTIRRVQLRRRPRGRSLGKMSRNLSLPGYGCGFSQWNSTSIVFPRTRLADSEGESPGFIWRSESAYKSSFDEQSLEPHMRPNLLRASSLPLTVLLRKYSLEDPTSPEGSWDFLSPESGSSEDIFHSQGGLSGTFQQLTAAVRRVVELEEEVKVIPELKAQICVLQEERERLLHAAHEKMVETKNAVDEWMDQDGNQMEKNDKASSETKRDDKDKALVEALQKKTTALEQKLHEVECDLEKTTNLLKEQEQESRFKDDRINQLKKHHEEDVWVKLENVKNTWSERLDASVQTQSPESAWTEDNQVGLEEELKPCGPAGSQADMEQHVKKVRELLQEQWECLLTNQESGKESPSSSSVTEHLNPRVRSIQTQLVSLVELLTLYISPAGDKPPSSPPPAPPLPPPPSSSAPSSSSPPPPPECNSYSAEESVMEEQISVEKTEDGPKHDSGRDCDFDELMEGRTRPEDPAEEEFNQNFSQIKELLTSIVTSTKQEVFSESMAENTQRNTAEDQEEQDRTGGAEGPQDQAGEKQDGGTCSQAPSEEAAHGEGGRGVEPDFMDACHFLEKHMDEVSEPNDEMRQALTVVFQQWFHICAEEKSHADTVALYINYVGRETCAVLKFLVNMTDDNGNTALHYSVSHSNFSIVKVLLETGVCDVDLKNASGYTAIMLVSLQPLDADMDLAVVDRLMELGDVNARAGQLGQTALHLAVRHGRVSMVKLLLSHGANINAQDQAGTTALISACDRQHTDIVRILLQDPDCDANLTDTGGRSALSLSTQASHTEIADLIKARTTNANTKAHEKCRMA